MERTETSRMHIQRATQFGVREDGADKYIEGYFAVFGDVYDMGWGMSESIDPHAFDEAVHDDIRALINHDTTKVLGRTTAGTLELRVDEHGLWGKIRINPGDQDAMNLLARVQRGDVDQASFGFDILEEDVEQDRSKGTIHWTLKKVRLYEISPCTFPAYESTSLSARARERKDAEKRKHDTWIETRKEKLAKWH